jgi:hypothetical protein
MKHQPVIAVCGAGACDAHIVALAEEVGRRIAEAGATLVCGGLGGVMEAACRGAVGAGGLTIGILPGLSRAEANPFVQVAIPTNMGHARNVILVQTANVVIAISGEYGTLSEIALARKCGLSVVGLHTWDLGTTARNEPHIIPASTPAEAVAHALEQCGRS